MGNSSCCVINCRNNGKNSQCKFYSFPTAKHWLPQREKWIAAVNRINPDGTPWIPKKYNVICSAHFIGNKKSQHPLNPSFVPTIFPPGHRKASAKKTNIIHRRKYKCNDQHILTLQTVAKTKPDNLNEHNKQITADTTIDNNLIPFESIKIEPEFFSDNKEFIQRNLIAENSTKNNTLSSPECNSSKYADKECQINFFQDNLRPETTFICNRYINGNLFNDVEIQTKITETSRNIVVFSKQKMKSKSCGTPPKTYVDRSVGPDGIDYNSEPEYFTGFSSLKNDKQLLDLAGVNFCNFNFLLQKLAKKPENCKLSKENRLFIYLVKKKTGLSFSALSVLFCVHRTTISRILKFTAEELTSDKSDINLWPNELKYLVQNSLEPVLQDDKLKKRKIDKE